MIEIEKHKHVDFEIQISSKEKSKNAKKYIQYHGEKLLSSLDVDHKATKRIISSNRINIYKYTEVDTKYLYDVIFKEIERKDDGKLEMPLKWMPVFDGKSTPNTRKYDNGKGETIERKYGKIYTNGKISCYLINFSLEEIIQNSK